MKQKSEVANIYKNWEKMIEVQYGKAIKCLHSDNEGEYINKELEFYFEST